MRVVDRLGKPLYEWIFHKAQERGLAEATALRGLNFDAHSQLHSAKVFRLSSELPIVVEIVEILLYRSGSAD